MVAHRQRPRFGGKGDWVVTSRVHCTLPSALVSIRVLILVVLVVLINKAVLQPVGGLLPSHFLRKPAANPGGAGTLVRRHRSC